MLLTSLSDASLRPAWPVGARQTLVDCGPASDRSAGRATAPWLAVATSVRAPSVPPRKTYAEGRQFLTNYRTRKNRCTLLGELLTMSVGFNVRDLSPEVTTTSVPGR